LTLPGDTKSEPLQVDVKCTRSADCSASCEALTSTCSGSLLVSPGSVKSDLSARDCLGQQSFICGKPQQQTKCGLYLLHPPPGPQYLQWLTLGITRERQERPEVTNHKFRLLEPFQFAVMERLFSFTPGQVATVSRSAYACKTDREKEKKEEEGDATGAALFFFFLFFFPVCLASVC
jgi:hypothetical protein